MNWMTDWKARTNWAELDDEYLALDSWVIQTAIVILIGLTFIKAFETL